ncbi:MAG: helix-turn-helix transcriptional regulator [Eubacteriaceae bacterium]
MNISEKLINLRNQQNVSQYKLAKLSGVSQAGLSDIELGKKQPTVHTLEKILQALNISWAEFFAEDAPAMPPDIRRIMETVKKLTPNQREALQHFLETLQTEK